MPRPSLLAFAAVSSLAATAAFAEPRLAKHTQELAVHVSPDFEGAVGDTIFVEAGYGRFLRDRFSLRGTVSYTILEDVAGADSDYRTSQFGLAAEWHAHDQGPWVPYLGAGLGWRSSHFGDFEEAALAYGPRAGIKLFLADNVALDFEVTYQFAPKDVFVNDFVAEDHDLTTAIGLRVMF